MAVSESSFESLAIEIVEHIAFLTVAGCQTQLLGPPKEILPLLLTSRSLHGILSFDNNSHLYAKIFDFKFDSLAPNRRLGPRWTTTPCLTFELRKRFTALDRIKRGDFSSIIEDLWTAYLLMIESDGKNETQLIEWAKIKDYLQLAIGNMANTVPGSQNIWFTETEGASLAVWLLWLTSNQDAVRSEPSSLARFFMNSLHPFVATGYRYPSVFAPDSHFPLPFCECVDAPEPYSSGPSPKVRTITHYSRRLTIATPPLTPAALLATTVRVEAFHDGLPLPPASQSLPPDRASANAIGYTGITLEDVRHFHYETRTCYVERCTVNGDTDSVDRGLIQGSMRHDEDWSRQVSCHDPWTDSPLLRGKVYTPGALTGSWSGRVLIPDVQAYWNSVLEPNASTAFFPVVPQGLYCTLQEHHCLHPNEPLMPGTDEFGFGDDILNAWFPKGTTMEISPEAVEVFDPTSGHHIRYETYYRRPVPYSKAVCETSWISLDDREEIAEDSPDSGSVAQHIDNDTEWSDVVEHRCSGVADILVTGETTEHHGNAWGQYSYIGRVRPWDGLIVLLRTPKSAMNEHLGRSIFKGYIHDRNFVGRWRDTTTNTKSVGFEGGFVMCQIGDS